MRRRRRLRDAVLVRDAGAARPCGLLALRISLVPMDGRCSDPPSARRPNPPRPPFFVALGANSEPAAQRCFCGRAQRPAWHPASAEKSVSCCFLVRDEGIAIEQEEAHSSDPRHSIVFTEQNKPSAQDRRLKTGMKERG